MYETLYKEFYDELHTTLASFYLWKTINSSTQDKTILKAFNRSPTSWIIIRHSLQVNYFITLHKIFETGKGHASVDALLKHCIDNTSIFSKENYTKRKDPKDLKPEWLEENVSRAYIPTKDDFQMLRGEFRKHKNTFDNIYKPIRSKIIAHKLLESLGKSQEFYAKTNLNELEDIIKFLYGLKEALVQLYQNGYKPDIYSHEIDIAHYERDFNTLIQRIKTV